MSTETVKTETGKTENKPIVKQSKVKTQKIKTETLTIEQQAAGKKLDLCLSTIVQAVAAFANPFLQKGENKGKRVNKRAFAFALLQGAQGNLAIARIAARASGILLKFDDNGEICNSPLSKNELTGNGYTKGVAEKIKKGQISQVKMEKESVEYAQFAQALCKEITENAELANKYK